MDFALGVLRPHIFVLGFVRLVFILLHVFPYAMFKLQEHMRRMPQEETSSVGLHDPGTILYLVLCAQKTACRHIFLSLM